MIPAGERGNGVAFREKLGKSFILGKEFLLIASYIKTGSFFGDSLFLLFVITTVVNICVDL